jgi:hypothetical protein
MSNYIHINSDINIFVKNLIAFLPKEGYIIFEGYNCAKKEDLPFRVQLYRSEPECNKCAIFDIEILEAYKKDLQLEMKYDSDSDSDSHDCEDECVCNISFFPLDIIIFKINILKKESEYPSIDWSYCIDNRFKTMDNLIIRYLNLLELPQDRLAPYESREEDRPFYKEYHKLMERGKDIFTSQFDEFRMTKEYFGLVNGAKKIPRPPRKDILPVLEKWNTLYKKTIRGISINYGNKQFLSDTMTFFNYIEEQIPFLLNWCAEYACDLPFQDKLRGWLTYGIKNAEKIVESLELRGFEAYWKLFFRRADDEADTIMLDYRNFDISYKHYLKLLKEMKEELKLDNCTNTKILDLHKDKEHNGGGFGCDYCEEQEMRWGAIVSKKYRSLNNIFINRKLGELFIEKWIKAVLKLEDTEKEKINFTWPPPRPFYVKKLLNDFGSKKGYSYDEYISELIKERDRRYHGYYVRPKVEFEFIQDLSLAKSEYSFKDICKLDANSDNYFNEIYLAVSHVLRYMPYILYMDKKRCNELIDIFSRLPDD